MLLDESAPKSEEILHLRWSEVERCLRAEAYLAATIMMGSLLEGVLFFLLQENREAACQCSCAPKKGGKVKNFAEWKLGEMIDAAREMRWIGHEITTLSQSVRDFRNSVHPAKQLKNSESPGCSVAKISWQIVQTAIRDEIGKVDSIAKGCEFQVIAKLADKFSAASVVGDGTVAPSQPQGGVEESEELDGHDMDMFLLIAKSTVLRRELVDQRDLQRMYPNPARFFPSIRKLERERLVSKEWDEISHDPDMGIPVMPHSQRATLRPGKVMLVEYGLTPKGLARVRARPFLLE